MTTELQALRNRVFADPVNASTDDVRRLLELNAAAVERQQIIDDARWQQAATVDEEQVRGVQRIVRALGR